MDKIKFILPIALLAVLHIACTNMTNEQKGTSATDSVNVIDSSSSEPVAEKTKTEPIQNSSTVVKQEEKCKKCDVKNVVNTEQNIEELKESDIHDFLCGFAKECANNAEYSGYSNEVLFMVLERYPGAVIKLASEEGSLNTEYIITELTQPVNDGIDVKAVYAAVESAIGDEDTKEKILASLRTAIKKYEG